MCYIASSKIFIYLNQTSIRNQYIIHHDRINLNTKHIFVGLSFRRFQFLFAYFTLLLQCSRNQTGYFLFRQITKKCVELTITVIIVSQKKYFSRKNFLEVLWKVSFIGIQKFMLHFLNTSKHILASLGTINKPSIIFMS